MNSTYKYNGTKKKFLIEQFWDVLRIGQMETEKNKELLYKISTKEYESKLVQGDSNEHE